MKRMLGMFVRFERDAIIDRVITGMERKHAKRQVEGRQASFGYQTDKSTHTLVVDEHEAVMVRLIFSLYAKDRLGPRHRRGAQRSRPPQQLGR